MPGSKDKTICPFFQGNDERCARRFNLQCLSEVFGQCLDEYEYCQVYHQLSVGQTDPESDADVHVAA
ncbi:MAG: hypothetical protein MI923_19245 [Phycisphaerales bacterium]|nr:hypothetical protein [Phycisphaerales bacterium]